MKIPSNASKLTNKNVVTKSGAAHASTGGRGQGSAGSNSETKTYTVRSGDTLWDIARRFGTTTGKIRGLNGLGRSSRIYPGQKLTIVGGDVNYIIHKVRRGETLAAIARKYSTTVARIRANNNIDNPDLLRIGETLKIYLN